MPVSRAMPLRRLPIRTLAFVTGALTTIVLGSADAVLLLRDQRDERLANAATLLQSQASLLAERLERGAAHWFGLLRVVGGLDLVRNAGLEERSVALRDALADLTAGSPELLWLGVLNTQGEVLAASDPFPALVAPRELVRRTLRGAGEALAMPQPGPRGPTLDIATPLGPHILAAQITLDWAETIRSAEERRGFADISITVIDAEGRPVLPPGQRSSAPPPHALEAVTAVAALGNGAYMVRASMARDVVVGPLRRLGQRLALGTIAIALGIGALAALLGHTARRAVESTRHRAEHDALTGLLNREGLAVWASANSAERFAVLALDLDGFKPINDTHGHAVGDELLKGVAGAMQLRLRPGDAAARLGGDEFLCVLLPRAGEDASASAEAAAARLIQALAAGVETSAGTLPVGCSAGYAVVPDDAPDLNSAIKRADAGLYAAKRAGRGTIRHCGATEGA
jgi:diguanylate cyclase (GGDEF)-like protein